MFKTGVPVTGDEFIDRKEHLPIFQHHIDQNQNIMIKAPRRFGKTSLVKHLLEDNEKYNLIYLDIRRFITLKSLSENILDKAYTFSGIDNFIQKSKKSIVTLLKSLKNVSIDDIGELTLEIQEEKIDDVEYFLHALDIANKIAQKKELHIQMVLDEFQDIIKIANNDILEKCRSVMQHHKNITYVFLGSIETTMTKIFEHKSSPFFHFTHIIILPSLDVAELFQYTEDAFKKHEITIGNLKNYLDFLGGHPDYSMQFLKNLYAYAIINQLKHFNDAILFDILIETIDSNKAYIDELISKSKSKKHHSEQLAAIANNEILAIDSRTSYIIKGSLEDMGLISKIDRGDYRINDIFLNLALKDSTLQIEDFAKMIHN